jgi:hypothetical protein
MTIEELQNKARVFGCTDDERDLIRAHYNPDDTLNACRLCGINSNGAVGVAGIYWRSLCQACKNDEDRIASARVKCVSNLAKHLTRVL